MAADGLARAGVPSGEFEPGLKIIEQRVATRQTGSAWIVESVRKLRQKRSLEESLLLVTQAMTENCLGDRPVHCWELPDAGRLQEIPGRNKSVESVMISHVITVRDDDLLELAATLMEWNRFHHLPVENPQGIILGIISATDIGRYLQRNGQAGVGLVRDCMTNDIVTVCPETRLDRAEKLMKENGFGSLPVVREGRVVGIVTVNDIRGLKEEAKQE
jgi:CBS domain-containing protein